MFRQNWKLLIPACVVICVLSVIGIVWIERDHLVVSDQRIDRVVVVDEVELKSGGYIVVTGIRYAGPEGIDFLTTGYLPPGKYHDIQIPYARYHDQSGGTFEPIEPIRPGNYLIVQTLRDDGRQVGAEEFRGEDFEELQQNFQSRLYTELKKIIVEIPIDPWKIKAKCDEKRSLETRADCIQDAVVETLRKYPGNYGVIIDLCSVVEVDDRKICYQSMGAVLQSVEDSAAVIEDVCSRTMNDQYETWCLDENE